MVRNSIGKAALGVAFLATMSVQAEAQSPQPGAPRARQVVQQRQSPDLFSGIFGMFKLKPKTSTSGVTHKLPPIEHGKSSTAAAHPSRAATMPQNSAAPLAAKSPSTVPSEPAPPLTRTARATVSPAGTQVRSVLPSPTSRESRELPREALPCQAIDPLDVFEQARRNAAPVHANYTTVLPIEVTEGSTAGAIESRATETARQAILEQPIEAASPQLESTTDDPAAVAKEFSESVPSEPAAWRNVDQAAPLPQQDESAELSGAEAMAEDDSDPSPSSRPQAAVPEALHAYDVLEMPYLEMDDSSRRAVPATLNQEPVSSPVPQPISLPSRLPTGVSSKASPQTLRELLGFGPMPPKNQHR